MIAILALALVVDLGRAEELAARQELDAAIDLYKQAIASGIDGADIRYNLGTLFFEQNRLGEAVLHLRAAKRLDPYDDDIRHNLAVALEMRSDRLSGALGPSPIRWIGEAVSPRFARFVFATPMVLLGLSLAALGFASQARPRHAAKIAMCACFILVALGGLIYGSRVRFERVREAVVIASSAPALKDADAAAAPMFVAHAGLYGDVVDERAPYVRLRFENGLEAWLDRKALDFVP